MKCVTKYCRTKVRRGNKCDKCRTREWRQANPMLAAYHRKKWNAKLRNIVFTLTVEEFAAVWKPGLTIERVNSMRGYHADNVKPLEYSANSAGGYAAYIRRLDHTDPDNCPF